MLCCTSAPPINSLSGSRENTGQVFGATKQICGRRELPAGCNGSARPRRAASALPSRRLSVGPSMAIWTRDSRIAGLSSALTVHHSNRQPQEDLLRSRCEVAPDDAGDQKARQSGRGPLVESAQDGAQDRIHAQCAKILQDVDEVAANEKQADYAHVEDGLQVGVVSLRHSENTDPDSRAHGVGPENRPETVAVNGAAQYLGQKGQPDPFDAPGADGVESASEPAFHAIVYCARKEKRRDHRQEPEEHQGFCVAAPEQEQHVDRDEAEEG